MRLLVGLTPQVPVLVGFGVGKHVGQAVLDGRDVRAAEELVGRAFELAATGMR